MGKCAERIDEELRERMEDVEAIINAKDPIEELNERTLALSKTIVYTLEFSWGGPQDFFIFEYDPEAKQLKTIKYCFLDWFDGAEKILVQGTKEFDLLEKLFYETIFLNDGEMN